LHLLAFADLVNVAEVLFNASRNGDIDLLPKSLSSIAQRIQSLADFCTSNIDIICRSRGNALHISATREIDDQFLSLLLRSGANVNETDSRNWRAIHTACIEGSVSKLKALEAAGASLCGVEWLGRTPLHFASWRGQEECVQFLIDKGCSLQVFDRFGATPIQEAAESGNLESFDILINAAPDLLFHRDKKGRSLVHVAALNRRDIRILERLVARSEMDISSQDLNGDTALHMAVSCGDIRLTELLLNAGTDSSVRNQFGYSPLDLALIRGQEPIARLIHGRSQD
jgi:ankyrin repeat protein